MSGLKKWFAEKWVDIGAKKKDGSFQPCGRSKQKADAKRKAAAISKRNKAKKGKK